MIFYLQRFLSTPLVYSLNWERVQIVDLHQPEMFDGVGQVLGWDMPLLLRGRDLLLSSVRFSLRPVPSRTDRVLLAERSRPMVVIMPPPTSASNFWQ
jgi:hypothetical protein